VIIYAGRVSREKNLAVIMALDEALRRVGRDYRLVFVGDGPMRGEIEHALPKAIVVGSVPHERMGEYLASADVFAFPSRTDTAGNVVLEAQASGLPCVVMEEGGPKENVWTNRSAFVTATDRAFVDAVCRLVADDEVRGAMASAARTYALTRDWPGAFAPLFATYRRLVDARQAADAMTLAPATPSDTA
jgi:glycosyltransferase involved in cell wall biosynthesis